VRKAFVADASVAVAWVHPAQATAGTQAMLESIADGATLAAPALWPLDVANALLVLVRRRKLSDEDRRDALKWLRDLPIQIDHEMGIYAFTRLSDLASKHTISLYDAAYLDLAKRRKLPLACKDGPLCDAANEAGVKVWR
jgi:predicted nucleic acid-binding protein